MRVLMVQKMAGVAGAETYYLNLLPALVGEGVNVSFLIIEKARDQRLNDEFAERLMDSGVHVLRRAQQGQLSWGLIRELASIVEMGRFDVVQSNLIHADLWLAIVKRLLLPRMALVSTKHGYSDVYQQRHGLDPAFIRPDRLAIATWLAASQADRVIAISRGLGRLLSDSRLVNTAKIEVIPYGFTFDVEHKLAPGEARTGSPQIITVGRLVAVKQNELLIRTVARILPSCPGVKLVIIGGGPEEARLKGLAKDLGIAGSVFFAGYITNPHDYLRDSDLFVLPSAGEGFGAVILEAWHNGLPVVAFDVPAQNEIITDGWDGFLVEPFDGAQLQHRIVELVSDAKLRQTMGERGRRTYEDRYTIDMMTARTLAVYESVASRRDRETNATLRPPG